MGDPIYLDHNATTPLLPEVVDAMLPFLTTHFGNPSSSHVYGRRAKEAVESARARIASLIGCAADEVIFTSGGTEASNFAIRGACERSPRRALVTTAIEHPATLAPCAWLEARGYSVARVGVDSLGRARLDELASQFDERVALVSVMHANNETGVMQPVADIARLARPCGALVHVDAAQSLGKVSVRVDALGADLLSIAGHKLYAPKGVGALYVRRGTPLAPFARGAGHERGMRPGTENVASIVGLGVACEIAARDLDAIAAHASSMRDRLFEALCDAVPGLALNGHVTERLPNTLNVRFPGVSGSALLAATPDVAASTGSACHADGESASSVILAMGVDPREALGSVRLTTGRMNTADDIDRAARRLIEAWRRLRVS